MKRLLSPVSFIALYLSCLSVPAIAGAPSAVSNLAAVSADTAAVPASRLWALSVRTESGPGANVLIVGVAVTGTSATEKKQVIVRGVGPGLRASGVATYLPDPVLSVYSGGGMIAYNDDWDYALRPVLASVWLDNLERGSKDAVLMVGLADSGYSVQVGAIASGTGVALAEIYETDSTTTSRMSALSVRAMAGTAEQTLMAGFIIQGSANKRVVIRGLGPALARDLSTGFLADPKLEVYSGSTVIASNDDWGNTQELRTAFASVGLLPMEVGSKDASLIVDLPPGGYSVWLTGVGNTTGIGMIEIYELP